MTQSELHELALIYAVPERYDSEKARTFHLMRMGILATQDVPRLLRIIAKLQGMEDMPHDITAHAGSLCAPVQTERVQ